MDGDAFEVVVGHHVMQLRRVKIVLRQAARAAGHGNAGRGVGVHHAMRAGYVGVDRAVDGEAGRVHMPGRVVQLVALQVDLEQIAGRHLAVVQTERVDQELRTAVAADRFGQTQRDVVVNHLGPAQHVEDAVAGGQLDACLLFQGMVVVECHGGS